MCARAVVVQDAADDQLVLAGVVVEVVDAVNEDAGIVGQGQPLGLALERRALDDRARAGGQVAAQSALRVAAVGVRITELAGAVHHQAYARVAPGDVLGVAYLPQEHDLLAVRPDDAVRLIDDLNVALAPMPPEKAVEWAVGAVLAHVLGDRLERGTHGAAHVDDEAVEVIVAKVVPESQLADAPQAVYPQRSRNTHDAKSLSV